MDTRKPNGIYAIETTQGKRGFTFWLRTNRAPKDYTVENPPVMALLAMIRAFDLLLPMTENDGRFINNYIMGQVYGGRRR